MQVRTAAAAFALALLATGAAANEPFYKGKRLSVLINYGAGGPADIEGRLFARHVGKYIDGNPNVIVQNIDGAGGLIGTTYLGEVAPKDGTMMGHLTGVGWRWAFDSESFRVDFGTYEFLGYQTSTTVAFMRTDVPPGIKAATDIIKVQSLISGGLGPDNAKDLGDPALARSARHSAPACHQLSQQRACAARAAAGRDQFLFGIAAELSLGGASRHRQRGPRDPGLARGRARRPRRRSRWPISRSRRSTKCSRR